MNDDDIRQVTPREKISTRIWEVQQGVRRSTIIPGRGIAVTETPHGVIVELREGEGDGDGSDTATIIPRWG